MVCLRERNHGNALFQLVYETVYQRNTAILYGNSFEVQFIVKIFNMPCNSTFDQAVIILSADGEPAMSNIVGSVREGAMPLPRNLLIRLHLVSYLSV